MEALTYLMANYNNARYLAEAVESVLAQTSTQWKLLICDDCSTDNSLAVIKPYLKDSRVKLLQNKQNLGYTASLKRLIEHAETDIVCMLDSDDALTPNATAEILKGFQKSSKTGLVYSRMYTCDAELNVEHITEYVRKIPNGETILRYDCVNHVRAFRRHYYAQTSGLSEDIRYAEDKDLLYKLEEVCDFYCIEEPLYYHRRLLESQSHNPRKAAIGYGSHIRAIASAYRRRKKGGAKNISKREYILKIIKFRLIQLGVSLPPHVPDRVPVKPSTKNRPGERTPKTPDKDSVAQDAQRSSSIIHFLKSTPPYQSARNLYYDYLATQLLSQFQDPGGFLVCHSKKVMCICPTARVSNLVKRLIVNNDYSLSGSKYTELLVGFYFDGYSRVSIQEADSCNYDDFLKVAISVPPLERFLAFYSDHFKQSRVYNRGGLQPAQVSSEQELAGAIQYVREELKKPTNEQAQYIRLQSEIYGDSNIDSLIDINDFDAFSKKYFGASYTIDSSSLRELKKAVSPEQAAQIQSLYHKDYNAVFKRSE